MESSQSADGIHNTSAHLTSFWCFYLGNCAGFCLHYRRQLVAEDKNNQRLGPSCSVNIVSLDLSRELWISGKRYWNWPFHIEQSGKWATTIHACLENNPVALVLEEQHWSYLVLPFLKGAVGQEPLACVGTATYMHNFPFQELLLQCKWGTNWNVSGYFCCKLKQISLYFRSFQ